MARLAHINKRIRAKLAELDDDRAEREHARNLIGRIDVRIDVLEDELARVRRRIQRRRATIAEVKEDLDQVDDVPEDGDAEEEAELRALLDRLSGEYDEAITTRDRILNRLDRLQDKNRRARFALQQAVDEYEDDRQALKRLRDRRRRIEEAKDRPSPNFDWAEFDCKDGTPLPEESKPAVKHWCLTVGEPVRAKFGSVHINSAFRHRVYNARIGGESNSVHIYDFPGRDFKAAAVAFSGERGTPADWYAFTAGKADGRGRYATFHHADNRNRIGWPDAVWSG